VTQGQIEGLAEQPMGIEPLNDPPMTSDQMTKPQFDQQQAYNGFQAQKTGQMIDQRIEERESLRHSTHRSQRSERVA